MADLFAPPTSEEVLDRKIVTVGVLINRFEEQLKFAATLDPRILSLQRAGWIMKDLLGMTALVDDLKKEIYSKKTE